MKKKALTKPSLEEIDGVRNFLLFYNWAYPKLTFKEKIDGAINYYKRSIDYNFKSEMTIRVRLLINDYLAQAGIEDKLVPSDLKGKAIQKLHSINKYSKMYKPPTIKEMNDVIQRLTDSPTAFRAAINDLEKIE